MTDRKRDPEIISLVRWANVRLKKRGMNHPDIENDFKDGVALINLLEILEAEDMVTKKKTTKQDMDKYYAKPNSQIQRAENCLKALDFIKKKGIVLTNIGPNDLEEGSVKLTAAVLFKLMEHYQLGMGYQQAKKDLLAWVQSLIPDYNILGFTAKQWNDGKAMNAIINAIRGGLCKDHASLSTGGVKDREKNWGSAITVGLDKFKIPQLCDAEDLASDEMDERSLVMYLSYYQHIPPSQAKETTCTVPTSALIGVPMIFEVTMPKDDPMSEVKCSVANSGGKSSIATEYLGNGKFRCTYTPTDAGGNNVSVQVDGNEIPGGPFTVSVATIASLCTCTCPDKAVLGKPLEFEVKLPKADVGKLACAVKSSSGTSSIATEDLGGGRYKCSFTPTESGANEVSVQVDGVEVPGGPFSVKVDAFAALTECKVPTAAVVAMPLTFEVRTPDENSGTVACSLTQSNGTTVPIATKHLGGGKYSCTVMPTEAGSSKVSVQVDGNEVTDGPFVVEVDPLASKCRATGPGVEGKPETFANAHFAVLIPTDPSSPKDDPLRQLEVKVTGPDGEVETTLTAKGGGEWHVDYTPLESGDHYVSVRVGGVGIPGSAFKVSCEMPNTLFAGWLDKQARGEHFYTVVKNWKTRFFVLVPDGNLKYFNSHGSKKKISLEEDLDESKRKEKFDCNLKTASTLELKKGGATSKDCSWGLTITADGKKLQCAAKTEATRERFIKAITNLNPKAQVTSE